MKYLYRCIRVAENKNGEGSNDRVELVGLNFSEQFDVREQLILNIHNPCGFYEGKVYEIEVREV